jgi:hypothetical protein
VEELQIIPTAQFRAYPHKPAYFVDHLAEQVGQFAAAFCPK